MCRWKPKKLPGLPAASRDTVPAGEGVQLRRSHCCSACNWRGGCSDLTINQAQSLKCDAAAKGAGAGCRQGLSRQVAPHSCAHHWVVMCTAQLGRDELIGGNCRVHLLVDDRPGTRRKVASNASSLSSMREMNSSPLSWRRKAPGGAHNGVSDRWPAQGAVSVEHPLGHRVAGKCSVPCSRCAVSAWTQRSASCHFN